MTGRMASAPRVSGLRRRGRRAFLPAVLGASLSTLLLVLALAAPKLARAHEDSEEEGHASPNGTHGYHFEYYDRPPPPPPAQPAHYVGGVYDKNHSQTWHGEVEVVCTVVVKPGAYLAITPGATIKFRPNCTYEDAKLWGLTDPGGVGVSKPSIVVMRGAKLYAAGTAEKPIVFRPVDVDHSHHSHHSDDHSDHSDDHSDHSEGGYVRGAWGGIVVMGTARVGWNAGAPTPDVETIVDRSGDAEFSAWYDEAPDAGHVASHVTHDAYAVARVPSGVFPSVPGLFGADGFLEYGGFRDNSSCGVVEHVVVLGGGGRNESNPAAGHGTDGYDMPALGFFGCGFATKVEHVEVAHSAGHGLYLGGGMVSPRRVAAWDNAGAGVKTTAGYRGVLDELFVHVPRGSNATGIRAEGFWAHGGGTADESVYRTHPMIFHATVVAEPNPPPPPMNESAASAACQRPSWVGSDGYGALDGTDRDEIYGTGSNTCQREYFPLPSGCEIAQDSDETLEVIRNHPWGTHAMNTQTAVYSTSSYPESIWQRSPLVRVGAGGENEYKPFSCQFRILIICCPGPPPPPPPPPLPALVQIARGSGATVGNSIIAPSTEGGVAFSVDDCSPKLRVGHFRDVDPSAFASKSNDAVAVDDRVAVAGLGDDPPTKNSDYRDHDGSWSRRVVDSSPMPFNLGAGCEDAPLWRVNRNPPQFRSGSFTLDPRNATANRLDPRATAAMVAAAELDPVPPRIVDGVATRRDARTTWMLDSLFYRPDAVANGSADGYESTNRSTNGSSAAQSTSTPAAQSTPAAHPGAFGPTHALPWFARVEADGDFDSRTRGATIAPLTRSDPDPGYATMAAYADDACDGERLGEVAVRRGACYQVPDWIQAGDSPLSRLLPEEMHSTTSRGLHLIATSHTGDQKFSEAAVVNGKAVFTPFDVPAVYVVDLSTMETSIWDLPEPLGSSTWKFRGAAAAGGKVIFAPYKADDVGVFDPNDGSFEAISVSVEVVSGDTARKFWGATRANNGHVIFAPSTAAGVGVFNLGAKTFELVAKDALANTFPADQKYKFSGAVTAANGKIVFVPDHANGVGVFDPNGNSFVLVDISAPSSTVDLGGLSSFTIGGTKFCGGASASNGKVVFAPYVANGVGVFDPNDNSFVLVDISAPSTTVNLGGLSGFTVAGKFGAAAAASNGNIIFAPFSADGVGLFERLSDFHFCVPTCNPGYVLKGVTACTNRVLTEKAVCVWPIANGTELKAVVGACLDAVPSGEKCCSSDPRCWYDETAMRRCGALGCSDMPDWDVSQVMDAQSLFAGRSSFFQDITGWTFSDDAITTGMFTGADTWLSHLAPDEVNTTDGPPSHWNKLPCLENEHVESGWCVACRIGWIKAAGDDPHGENTACSLPFPSEGPHAYFACSYGHTCAVSVGGEMKCWGNGANGQLGYGDTQNRGDGPGEMGDNLPILHVGGSSLAFKVKAVSVGISHTCAILNDGSVRCWGSGANGRLGYGDTLSRGDSPGEMGDNLPVVDLGRFEFAEPWPFVPYPCAKMKSYGFNVDPNRCSARDYRSHCPRPMDVKTNAADWPS